MNWTTLLLLGAGLWWISSQQRPAPSTTAVMPEPRPGETSRAYADRLEAWGMATGQMWPTMEGYGGASFGRTGPMWRSMGMVPA